MKQEQYLEIQGPMAAHLNARARGLSPTKRALLERLLTSRKSDLPAAAKSRDKRLMAYVTLRKNHSATSSDLRSFLRERLPEYMVPGEILALEEMPLTASGKIDRKRLPSMNGAGRQLEREYIGARTAIEEILVGIFEEVLRLDRVGVRDNFFEIGGHSLLATQVISRVRSAFGVEVGVRSVFEKPTVEGLARKMEEAIGAGEKDEAPPLVKASREGRLPLSFAQQRLWFIDQLEPGNAVYNCPVAVRLEGRLNLQALESAVNEIVRRHEALRTRIEAERGAPAQVIDEWKPRRLEVEDLTDLTPEEREIEALRRVREEARTGFDLSRGPLLRVKALKLGAEQHVVLFNMHHIVSDAWSMGVLIKEVCALYEATSEGKESPLPELEIQYADYAKWQREYLAGGVLEGEIAYWKEKLKDAAVLELPTDYPRPATPSYRGGSERVTLGRDVSERLKRLSQREGATLFMTLMAAFKVVLMRYSGKEDLSVGTVIANRTRKEVEGLIGFFVNTLVMRTDLSGNPSFRELIGREREVALGAYARQEAPFEKLVEEINPGRDLSRNPLFQVMMTLENAGREELDMRGLKVSGIGEETGVAKFDLELMLTEEGEVIRGSLEYSQDLYEGETIGRMARHYERVVTEVVRDAEQKIREIELMGAEERRQILDEWNETGREWGGPGSVPEMIEEHARRSGEAIAVISEQGALSYGELNRRANQLAHYLDGRGVGREDLVGVCADRSPEMIIAILGVLKAGAAYLPIDASYPEERVRYMLADAAVKTLLTQGEAGRRLAGQEVCAEMRPIDLEGQWNEIAAERDDSPKTGVTGDQLAYVIYTSGSTGKPKGVMIAHRGLSNLVEAQTEIFRLTPQSRVLQFASTGFDASVSEIFCALASGASLHLHDQENLMPGGELERVLADEAITAVLLPPTALVALRSDDFRELETVISGGEACSAEIVERWARGRRFINAYGPTEITVIASVGECLAGSGRRPSIGRPIRNTKLYVLDGEMMPTPIGVKGELHLTGAGMARGYRGRPEQTAERFLPNPWSEAGGERLYRTGDVVRYLPNGEIDFIGRDDEQVKIRGYRVELGEIEAVLNEHRSVRQSVVTASEDGRGGKRLVGYVVGAEGVTAAELKRHVRERLPEYMAPEAIMVLEEMPVTVSGKIDRKRLPEVEGGDRDIEQEYVGAGTPVEEIVAGIFGRVLKLDRVGIHDNFFELGGHSLLATQVISRVREVFGVEIGVRSLFEEPAVAGLAQRIEVAIKIGEKEEALPIVAVSRDQNLPLSFAQQRLWFIDQLAPNSTLYNIPGAVRLEGRLNLEAMERVINEVIRRHEALRTRMEVSAEGEAVQVIDKWEPRRLEVEDLTSLGREKRQREARRRAREEAGTGFDLRRGPLLRVKVLRLEEEEHVLLYTMHHIVSDGWSMGILVREVGELYRAYDAGEPSPLEELPIQYADFAVWQREWLSGVVLEKELEYWREQLAEAEALELPTDHPRPAVQSHRGARHRFVIEREAAEKLRALSQREGTTLFMTLLGGFDVVMSRYSGQRDVVLGTDIANRNRAEIEGLIGFFVNQLVMRVEVRGEESFRELLKRVRDVCLGAYAHQDVPFEKLVEELQPERDLGRSPLFQAKLILQNMPGAELELEGLRLSGLGEDELETARLDLTVAIAEAGRDLVVITEYDRELFEPVTIERLIGHYGNILKGIVEEEERAVSELSLLSDEEREQIVEVWNQTARQYPGEECLHKLFAEQARQAPERIAVVSEWEQLSYRELNRRANQLGRYLQRVGVGPEVVVGLCLERSVEMVVGALGALKAGGAYLPLDAESPLERLGYMLEDAGVGVVLTQRALEARLPVFWGQTVLLDEEWERIGEESDSEPESVVDAENLAYVIYTSGSTGRPKGVMVKHGGLANYLRWASEAYRIGEGAGAPVQSSIGFDLTVTSLYGPLVSGRSVRLLPEAEGIEGLSRALSRDGGYSLVKITPAHLGVLAEQLESVEVEGRAGVLVIGGEALKSNGLKYWQERARGTRLINEYGPTETVVGCCVYEVGAGENGREAVPIGRPIANARMYILDEYLEPAPIGVNGEIYISGAGLARGYLGKAELTAERFIPNRFGGKDGERMYRTGDVGRRLPDGNLEFIGRADRQVKVRGYRIELGEIEAVLNEHRSVRQSVVTASEDGRGGKRLVGYVVGAESVTTAELKRHVKERLPEYMIPEAIMVLEEMPVTVNGKIDRKRLPSMNDAGIQLEREYLGARTAIEEILVGIFEEVLGLDRVGVRDNFFEIGGHSLLATQVISRVRSAFGVEIGIRSIFEKPTVEGLRRRIEEAMMAGERDEPPPLVRVSRKERLPLSFAQQRLWLIDQLEPDIAVYIRQRAVRLEGRLNLEALERSVNEVVRRHEALRTRIEVEKDEPVQVIDKWEPRRLAPIDLTNWTPQEREEEVERIIREDARAGFDLRQGPLVRMKVLRLGSEDHVVLFTIHHIVSDAWSMGVLVREVCELYDAISKGKDSPLPELEIQYSDYAYWQRQYLVETVMEERLAYWKKQLGGRPSALDLPVDHPRPLVPSYRGATRSFSLSAELSQLLRALIRQEGVTLFMALLAAFKTLLYKYTGQKDIIVGTSASNRNRAEIEPLIGYFVDTLPMRTDLSGNPKFRELLRRVKEAALGGYTHQDLPFEMLIEEIQPERSARQIPLFNVAFGLQNALRGDLKLEGLKIRSMITEQEWARFDLSIWITEDVEEIQVSWIYSQDLFEEGTVIRMHGHFETLLFSIVDRPDARLNSLNISFEDGAGLTHQEQGDWEDLEAEKPISIKRKGINLSTEPA